MFTIFGFGATPVRIDGPVPRLTCRTGKGRRWRFWRGRGRQHRLHR
jgi:hypothetical protein